MGVADGSDLTGRVALVTEPAPGSVRRPRMRSPRTALLLR